MSGRKAIYADDRVETQAPSLHWTRERPPKDGKAKLSVTFIAGKGACVPTRVTPALGRSINDLKLGKLRRYLSFFLCKIIRNDDLQNIFAGLHFGSKAKAPCQIYFI